jgi:hypothetical protein
LEAEFEIAIAAWILAIAAVTVIAGKCNRSPVLFGLLAAVLSPVISFTILMIIGEKSPQASLPKNNEDPED